VLDVGSERHKEGRGAVWLGLDGLGIGD